MRRHVIWASLFSVWAGLVVILASAPTTAGASSGSPQATAPATPQQGYVGADTCATCHEGYDKSVEGTTQGFKANDRTPAAKQGCEPCHGPGEAHATDPEKRRPPVL